MTFIEHFIGLNAFDQIRLLMLSVMTLKSIFPRNLPDLALIRQHYFLCSNSKANVTTFVAVCHCQRRFPSEWHPTLAHFVAVVVVVIAIKASGQNLSCLNISSRGNRMKMIKYTLTQVVNFGLVLYFIFYGQSFFILYKYFSMNEVVYTI